MKEWSYATAKGRNQNRVGELFGKVCAERRVNKVKECGNERFWVMCQKKGHRLDQIGVQVLGVRWKWFIRREWKEKVIGGEREWKSELKGMKSI